MKSRIASWFSVLWCVAAYSELAAAAYFGKSLGRLSEFHHGVSGHVYAVDGRTIFIKDFTYDGEGPAAFFYVGNTKTPSNNGAIRLRDERGSTGVLKRYRKKNITLSLPEGKTLHSIKWFSIWCDEFSVNFGDVKIPKNLDFPKPQKISGLSGVHGVSSDPIVIVDAQTLLIPHFSYDGEAPDAKFWVGRGDKPSPQGIRIPDENGKTAPLRSYDHKTIVLTLPDDLTVFDIGHFGVWCEAFTVDFGHVLIKEVNNVPPSLKMLGVSPQKRNQELVTSSLADQSIFSSGNRQTQTGSKVNKYQEQNGNLKATTYRPQTVRFNSNNNAGLVASLEQVPAGRFEAPLNVNDANFQLLYPVSSSIIHRRADEFQPPPAQQLQRSLTYTNNANNHYQTDKDAYYGDKSIIQPSREIYVGTQRDENLLFSQISQQQILRNQQLLLQQLQRQQQQQQLLQQQQQQNQPSIQRSQQTYPLYQTQQTHPVLYQSQQLPLQAQPVNFLQRRLDLDLGNRQLLAQQQQQQLLAQQQYDNRFPFGSNAQYAYNNNQ